MSKTVNGVTTYFIYDGHKLLGEYDQNGDLIKEYLYYNSTPIAIITPTTIEKIYADHLDTPRRVVDTTNNIIWKWESSPFGETKPIGTYTLNLRFPGQYFDSESGTHYNINRDYNPVTGRYIQSDPIGFDGGVNGFGYVNANPLLNVDLEGLTIVYSINDSVSNLLQAGYKREFIISEGQSKWLFDKQIVVVFLGVIVPNGFTNYTMEITPVNQLWYDTITVWFTGGSASIDKYMIYINDSYTYMDWKIKIPYTTYQNAKLTGGVTRYATVYSYAY